MDDKKCKHEKCKAVPAILEQCPDCGEEVISFDFNSYDYLAAQREWWTKKEQK